jgi:hypothetical protein
MRDTSRRDPLPAEPVFIAGDLRANPNTTAVITNKIEPTTDRINAPPTPTLRCGGAAFTRPPMQALRTDLEMT